MIVELFGAAGAGKTTLARAAAVALCGKGHGARVVSSARPAEAEAASNWSRLWAPCIRALKMGEALATRMRAQNAHDRFAQALLAQMQPESRIWKLRYARYLSRLHRAWTDAARSRDIVIFDQGFMSALSSLMVLAPRLSDANVQTALRQVPRADVLVVLVAPPALIEARLNRRLAAQTLIERRFELDTKTNLKHIDAVARLCATLESGGERPVIVSTADDGLQDAIAEIVGAVLRGERAQAGSPASGAHA